MRTVGLVALSFVLTIGLAACSDPGPEPSSPAPTKTKAAPKKRPPVRDLATEIVVGGRRFDIGTVVVPWTDPGGFDGYSEKCFSLDQALPVDAASRPNADPKRYGVRSVAALAPAAQKRVRAEGWAYEDLSKAVWQFVLHYDVVGSSERCFRALHDQRGLSVHFMLDLDGTIWQTLDVAERAFHAAEANDRSVGVEIAQAGAYSTPKLLEEWYRAGPDGRVVHLFPEAKRFGEQRIADYVAAPWRNELLSGTIHGRKLVQYDFTEAQYAALAKLAAGLHRALPRIKLEAPREKDGKVVTKLLPEPRRTAFEGVIGHFHVSAQKTDPGPAFDWEWFLKTARAEAAAPRAR